MLANVSSSGTGLNIITGFSYGLISILPAMVGIVAAMLAAYFGAQAFGLPGLYGIGISAVGMLSLTGIVVSNDAYGPIVDNAKGIAEMSGMTEDVIDAADSLDSAGNTAKAITKGLRNQRSCAHRARYVHRLLPDHYEVLEFIRISPRFTGPICARRHISRLYYSTPF